MSEAKALSETKARQLFERTCQRLHDAGWDVVAVIEKTSLGSAQIVSAVKVAGETAGEKRTSFLRMVEYVAPVNEPIQVAPWYALMGVKSGQIQTGPAPEAKEVAS